MPDSRFPLGATHPLRRQRRAKAEAGQAAGAPKAVAKAPEAAGKAPEAAAKAPEAVPMASFQATFGQRYQSSKLSESDALARLAGAAIGRLPGLPPDGPLAAQVAAGRLDSEGVRLLQGALNAAGAKLAEDGEYGPRTHAALSKALKAAPAARPEVPKGRKAKASAAKPAPEGPPSAKAPKAKAAPKAERAPKAKLGPAPAELSPEPGPSTGAVQGLGSSLEGRTLRRSSGRATTFANGHIPYKGWVDVHNKQNRGIGAWGDRCAPTEYFCALPDALGLGIQSAKWWHNKKILVTNPENGKQVVVRIQDKGPHGKTGAAIDLSPVATEALGGALGGSIPHVSFQFAHPESPVGPVR